MSLILEAGTLGLLVLLICAAGVAVWQGKRKVAGLVNRAHTALEHVSRQVAVPATDTTANDEEAQRLLADRSDPHHVRALQGCAELATAAYHENGWRSVLPINPATQGARMLWRTLRSSQPWREHVFDGDSNHVRWLLRWRCHGDVAETLVLAVRGTASEDDALADGDADSVPLLGAHADVGGDALPQHKGSSLWTDDLPTSRNTPPNGERLRIHQGFHDKALLLLKQLTRYIKENDVQVTAATRILCVGHSLGGAVAHLVALALAWRWRRLGSHLVSVVTFGAPRFLMFGDKRGAEAEEDFLTEARSFLSAQWAHAVCVHRVVCYGDPVPGVPLRVMGEQLATHAEDYALVLLSTEDSQPNACDLDDVEPGAVKLVVSQPEPMARAGEATSLQSALAPLAALLNANNHRMTSYEGRLARVKGATERKPVLDSDMSAVFDKNAWPTLARARSDPPRLPHSTAAVRTWGTAR
jgi:hypothetical protein